MGYVSVDEPFSRPPRVRRHDVGERWSTDASIVSDAGYGELIGQHLDGAVIDLAGLSRFEIDRCALRNVTLSNAADVEITVVETSLAQSDLPGSELAAVNLDRVTAERVDLRECTSIGLKGIGRLDGFLVSTHQLIGLAEFLADAVGLDVEAD